MKIKYGKWLIWLGCILFAVLRVLQYRFALDADGFFVKDTLLQQVLSISLYAAMGIFVLVGIFLRFSKVNDTPAAAAYFCDRGSRAASLLVALSLAVYGAAALYQRQWIGALALAAALYFVLLFLRQSGRRVAAADYLAVFALAYPCAEVILLFFNTFREMASKNLIETLMRCAMILMVLTLTKLYMHYEEESGKVAFGMLMYIGFGFVSIFGKIVGLFYQESLSLLQWLQLPVEAALLVAAIAVYYACDRLPQELPTDEVQESEALPDVE